MTPTPVTTIPTPAASDRPPGPRPAAPALRATLYVVAFFQLTLGAIFLLSPAGAADALGLAAAPAWTSWLFAMMAARFLGYGVGMIAAARDPQRHRLWITTMIGVQTVDWVATLAHVAAGHVTLAQVSTAAFLPVVFVVALVALRRSTRG
ncbi:MAG: hypothetical protein U0Q15_11815 [Kineosporiaceae bacterium]